MKHYVTMIFSFLLILACAANSKEEIKDKEEKQLTTEITTAAAVDTAYFAGGCFWCVEASFDQIEGVIEAISGYSGGTQVNPTYKEVSYGNTDHAEAVMVIYNPEKISFDVLLDIFFTAHDPTQLNRQGPDVGKQYRSAIFYTTKNEKKLAEDKMKSLADGYADPIVTQLKSFDFFHAAEDYHQDFEKKNSENRYIQNVSKPKIEKVAEKFKNRLKK